MIKNKYLYIYSKQKLSITNSIILKLLIHAGDSLTRHQNTSIFEYVIYYVLK